jgi:hypothetical protein
MAVENNSDALEDELRSGNVNQGVQGMPKPGDMVAAEKGGEGPQGGQAAAAGAGPQGGDGEGFDYTTILAKVDKGEELTNDELAIVAMMQKELGEGPQGTAAAAPKTYNIGGRTFSEDEIEQQMRQEYNLPADMQITDAGKAKMIERYVKSANRSEQQQRNQAQSEVNARDRQANMVERLHLQNERKRLQDERSDIKRERDRLTRVKETLTAAAKNIIPKEELIDPNTNQIDPEKLLKWQEARTAQAQLPGVEQELTELNNRETKNEGLVLQTEVTAFIAEHPQYATNGDPFELWNKLSRGESLPEADEIKVLELDQLISDSRAKGIPIEKQFTIKKHQRSLAVAEPAQPGTPGKGKLPLPELRSNPKTMAEIIRQHQARVKASPAGGGAGGGGGERGNGTMTAARATIEADKKILGNNADPFAKELGF